MAHYAFLDENNIVVNVIVGKDENEDGIDWEEFYGEIEALVCKRTSYNTRGGIYYLSDSTQPSPDQSKSFRKNHASIGYTYDYQRDAFIPIKPYNSWILDEQSCLWKAPVAYPTDGRYYEWDESTVSWKFVDKPV